MASYNITGKRRFCKRGTASGSRPKPDAAAADIGKASEKNENFLPPGIVFSIAG